MPIDNFWDSLLYDCERRHVRQTACVVPHGQKYQPVLTPRSPVRIPPRVAYNPVGPRPVISRQLHAVVHASGIVPTTGGAVHYPRLVELPLASIHTNRQRTFRANIVNESSFVLMVTVVPRQVTWFNGVRVVADRATRDRSDSFLARPCLLCLARYIGVVLVRK